MAFTDDANHKEKLTSDPTAAVQSPDNTPATGTVTITGTAQVGETLTAVTSGIVDPNGVGWLRYQWVSNDGNVDTDIPDATGTAYNPLLYDEGKTIKIRVSFTDLANNVETLTSELTVPVRPPPADSDGTNVCVRTPQVIDAILVDIERAYSEFIVPVGPKPTNCSEVTEYHLKAVHFLSMSNSDIDALQPWDFQGLTSMRRLHLNGNNLSELPNGVFNGLRYLSGLYLNDNNLSELPGGVFNGLTSLSVLDLSGNNLSELPDGLLYGRNHLKKLWLADNPGVPFTFTAELDRWEPWGDYGIRVTLAPGTPFYMTFTLAAQGGTLSTETLTTCCGGTGTKAIRVTPDGDGPVTVSVVSVAFNFRPNRSASGIQVGLGDPLIVPEGQDRNNPATGLPSIAGTSQVGQTLTADTSGIADADGLTNVSYTYQWIASNRTAASYIQGATASTYELSDDDVGKAIRVRVSFTDDAENQELLTSEATEAVLAAGASLPNTPPTGLPTVSGTAQVDETLTADTTRISDSDGLTNVSYSYQWVRNDGTNDADISGETASTYTPVSADVGKAIKVKVSFTDDAGNEETLTSAATGVVAAKPNSPATGAPTISGAAQAGETLTADVTGVDDEDGLTNTTFSYQWGRNDGNADTDIDGATGSTYEMSDDDVGKTIQVRVSFTDDRNHQETLTSAATGVVAAKPNSPATGAPTISGAAQAGETLTADVTGVDDEDGLTNATFSYQWGRNDGTNDADISGETASTYTLTDEDVGKTIQVRVSFTDDRNHQETLTSAATGVVAAKPNSPATGAPTISGAAQAGETLTADVTGVDDEDGLTNATFSYQWVSNDGNADTDIDGATGSTYEMSDDDVGKTIQVRVSFTDDRNHQETLTSAATGVVAAKPNSPATGAPTISGAAQAGETLTADMTGVDDEDGLTNATFSYQWVSNDGNADTDIDGATGSTYEMSDDDVGKTVKVRVSFTDDRNNEETLTSAATAAVAATPNSPATGLPTISGTAQVDLTLTADTSGISDADGLTNVSYSHQWIRNDGTTDSDIGGQTGSTYTLVSADEGKTIKVRLSFTDDAGNEETLTSAATAAVAAAPSRLTVSLENAATTHDGSAVFTLEIRFSEEFALSYTTLKFHAFDVTGGEVLKAQRMDKPSNIRWLITVGPDVNGDVTVVLPVTEDCAAQGAICTEDGRPLSNRLDMTVTGPLSADQNTEATGAPTISGTAQVDETLTADVSSINDADGLTNVSYSYQWIANDGTNDADIGGQTGSTYTLTDEDMGKTIKVRVSFTDDAGNEETLTSAATAAVASRPNTPATGLPTISGTPQVGEKLTAETSAIADADGLDNVSYSYQWMVNDGNDDADIEDATVSTYTLVSADEGNTIKVRVSFTDDSDNQETLTSVATDQVAAKPNSPSTGLLTISGTARVGETLTAETSVIADEDGLDDVSYSYQWMVNDGNDDADIEDATVSTYTLVSADRGKTIKVRVSFTDDAGNEETLTSSATAAVAVRPNTPATGLPTISGTAQVDETLTANISGMADEDGLTNVSYSYQWIRNDGTNDADIGGQTGSTYTLTDEDVGKTIKVKVSFTDDAGNEETLTSAATAAVAARPNTPATGLPTISGTAQAGKTLTANISGMADEDGLDNAEFSYQWLANDADIQNATDSTYTLTDDDVGKTIKVRVSFTDDRSNDETLTSAATDTVVAKPDSPDTDAPPRDPGATVDVTVGNTVTGEIEEAIEVDWFKVSLLASETYQIDMRGAWGGEWARIDGEIVWVAPGTLHDPKLLGVFSAANVLVPGTDEEVSGDDRGDYEEGKNSRITSFSPPADGYYYIAAAAEAAWTGTYELTVTVVADE